MRHKFLIAKCKIMKIFLTEHNLLIETDILRHFFLHTKMQFATPTYSIPHRMLSPVATYLIFPLVRALVYEAKRA